MSVDDRIKFIIREEETSFREEVEVLRAEVQALRQRVDELHTELHNAMSVKRTETPPVVRRTVKS